MAENMFTIPNPLQILYQLQGQMADTNYKNSGARNLDSQTEQNIMKTLMEQRALDQDRALTEARFKMSRGDVAAPQAPAPQMPAPQMNPAQSSFGSDGGEQLEGGALGPQQGSPAMQAPSVSAGPTPTQRAESIIDTRLKEAANYKTLAATKNIDNKTAAAYDKVADDIYKSVFDDRIKLTTQQQTQAAQIGNIAGAAAAAKTTQALRMAEVQINQVDPSVLPSLPVDRDPFTGQIVPTEKTFAAFDNLGQMAMKRSEQLTAQNEASKLQQTALRDKETARKNIANEQNADKRTAIYQQGVGAAMKNAETNAARESRNAVAADQPMVGTLSEDTARFAAETYLTTKVMPALGFGKNAAANRQQVLEMAAKIAAEKGMSGRDVAAAQGAFKADASSLAIATKSLDAVTAFTNTAIKNGDILVKMAQDVDATGIPVIEQWIRAGRQATGDPKVAAFNAQMQVYIPEVAKILSNPNLSSVLTVSAVREVKNVISNGVSADQLLAIHSTLKTDFANREVAIKNQIDEIKSRMGGNSGGKKESVQSPTDYADIGGVKIQGRGTEAAPYKLDAAEGLSMQQYNAIPKGASYMTPDGRLKVKQ